jgi:hypothetical protein
VTDRSSTPIIRASGLTKRFRRATRPPGLRGALTHLVKPRYESMTAVAGIVEGFISFSIAVGMGLIFFDIQARVSPVATVLFVVSVVLGFVTKVLVIFLITLLTFWTLQGVGH